MPEPPILRPEHFRRLKERMALTAAIALMDAELFVCRDQDEYLSLILHRKCIEEMRQRLEEQEEDEDIRQPGSEPGWR
jgi:hypothetical protein